VFENRVLRRIFRPKRDGVKGEWRKLHNEELHDLYSSLTTVRVIKSRRNKIGGACSADGGGEWCVLGFGGETGKRPLGRPRCRWEDNVKMDLQEMGCGVWTGSTWLRIGTGGERL
jgi:hypothetical protein